MSIQRLRIEKRYSEIVIHNGTEPGVDSYEIPDRIRESVLLRDVCEVFPHSSRAARRLDLDHTIPYTEVRCVALTGQ